MVRLQIFLCGAPIEVGHSSHCVLLPTHSALLCESSSEHALQHVLLPACSRCTHISAVAMRSRNDTTPHCPSYNTVLHTSREAYKQAPCYILPHSLSTRNTETSDQPQDCSHTVLRVLGLLTAPLQSPPPPPPSYVAQLPTTAAAPLAGVGLAASKPSLQLHLTSILKRLVVMRVDVPRCSSCYHHHIAKLVSPSSGTGAFHATKLSMPLLRSCCLR